VVIARGKRATCPRALFKSTNRITLLACVNAAGEDFLPAPVFKGVREPLITVNLTPRPVSSLLPEGWKAFWRKDLGSVDQAVFRKWVKIFVPLVRKKYNEDTWLIMFYDAARSHMTSDVIGLFLENKIAVMALPSHTSDRTQPLDLSVFGPLKHFTNVEISKCTKRQPVVFNKSGKLSSYDVLCSITAGYNDSFTKSNICSGFAKCGLWPFDVEVLAGFGIRQGATDERVVSGEVLRDMTRSLALEYKRHGYGDANIKSGFIDTVLGIELTRKDVLDLLKALEADRKEEAHVKEEYEDYKRAEQLALQGKKRLWAGRIEASKAADRVSRHNMPFYLPRSYKERRMDIRTKLVLAKAAASARRLQAEYERATPDEA